MSGISLYCKMTKIHRNNFLRKENETYQGNFGFMRQGVCGQGKCGKAGKMEKNCSGKGKVRGINFHPICGA